MAGRRCPSILLKPTTTKYSHYILITILMLSSPKMKFIKNSSIIIIFF